VLFGAARSTLSVLLVLGLTAALTACGTKYTYVKNSGERTYFKVPSSWHRLDSKDLGDLMFGDPDSATAQKAKQTTWYVAYDADPHPSVIHLMGGSTNQSPVVLAVVEPLTPSQQGELSLDELRNLGAPVTADARKQVQDQGGQLDQNFEWLGDQVLLPGRGLRGVREIYNQSADDPTDPTALTTIDRIALASDDGYLFRLILQCSAHCYNQRKGELDTIMSSFTVRKF